jgi:hypothetical protein
LGVGACPGNTIGSFMPCCDTSLGRCPIILSPSPHTTFAAEVPSIHPSLMFCVRVDTLFHVNPSVDLG